MDENNIFLDAKTSRVYLRLSLPLVLSMVVTLIYNLADTFFVARTGNTDLIAGVSLCAPVFTFLMAIGNIFGQGGSSLISRLIGQNDIESSKRASSFCFYITLIAGIFTGIIMLIFREPILHLLGSDGMTHGYASDYYTPLIIGTPLVMLSFIHSNLLRSEGMAKESMIGTVGGALVNIILDPLLISTFGYGAAGAAVATVIGYAFSDIYFLIAVMHRSRVLSASPRMITIKPVYAAEIIRIGIPAALANVMQSFTAIMTNQYLLPYGNDKIAAMGIVLKVSMIALLVLTGFAFGAQPLFGFYFGSNDRKRLRELLRFTLCFILAVACVITILIIISAPMLMKVFVDDSNMIRDGALMLRLQVLTMPLVGIVLLSMIIFQSAGKALGSFVLSISRQGVIFFLALLILSHAAGYIGIIASQAAADMLTAIAAIILFQAQLRHEFKLQ